LPKKLTGAERGGSEEEYNARTPQFFKDVGANTGLSPERTKYALGQVIPSGSMWAHLVGQGYEKAFSDLPKDSKDKHLAQVLAGLPVVRRFFGVTNPYSKHAAKFDKAEEDAVIKRNVENRGMDTLVEGHLYDKNVDAKELFNYAESFKDKDTYDRLIDRFKFEQAIKDLPEKSFWRRMKGIPTEAKAKVFVDRLNKSNEEQRRQLWDEYSIVDQAKGVLGKGFREEVLKLMGQQR
jgi:hypothetical protein